MELHQIKEGLKKPGKSRAGLAACLGVDVSQISRLLNGKRHLKVHELPLIQDYLWGGQSEPHSYQYNGIANARGAMAMGTPAASPYHAQSIEPKDNMEALELISELIDEAEKCHVDVADTILRALQNAIQEQRHPQGPAY